MKLPKLISTILHPIFLPTWMMVVMVLSGITRFTPGNDLTFIVVTLIITCLFPGVVVFLMKSWKLIGSLELDSRDDRVGPIFLIIISLYAAIRMFHDVSVLAMYEFYLSSTLVISVLAFAVTFFWKISLHTLGWGGFVGSLFIMTMLSSKTFLPFFIVSIILAGVAASARIAEKSHNNAQIYSGFAAGFLVVIVMYFFSLV